MSGFNFTDNSEQVLQELEQKMKAALTAVGMHLEGEAKEELENSPRRIDTGLLRNSITWALSGEAPAIGSYSADKPDRTGEIPTGTYSGNVPDDPKENPAVYIGTNVEYASYV